MAEKSSGKAAASTQKTANNSAISKKADLAKGQKSDAAKGQMSISAFFVKKPVQIPDAGTPKPPAPVRKDSPDSGSDEHKKNLQPIFEESISDPEISCVDASSSKTLVDTNKTTDVQINHGKEEDCIVISETTPASKSTKKDEPVSSKAAKSTSNPCKPKPKESKANKQSSTAKQQNTLHFSSNQDPPKSTPRPEKSRPPHPEGLVLNFEGDVLMVAEFVAKFRKFLGIEEIVTACDLNAWLKSDKMQPKSVASLHSKILALIIRDGETPDEERLLDDDTWPEVMRQHLEDTYAEVGNYARLVEQLTSKEYCDIEPSLRLQALVTLVDDCLQTKTIRTQLDLSVELVDDLKKQQQVEGLQEKYKKLDVESLPHIPFTPTVSNESQNEPIPEGMTERQKMKMKSKQEEERRKREEELKRDYENRKQAEEDSRRMEIEHRRERAEQRAKDIVEHSHLIRAKNCISRNENGWRHYVVLGCIGNRKRLLMECKEEGSNEGKWSSIHRRKDHETLLAHYSPGFASEKERGHHKHMKELIADADVEPESESEDMSVFGDATALNTEEQCVDEFEDVHSRARSVVLDMEECTPEDMFGDYEQYKKRRPSWIDGVGGTQGPHALCAFVLSFEKEIKRSKMLEGWDEVRAKWLQDLSAVSTNSVLLYLVKQLRVYLGRQKPKAGKLAAIFAGPIRMTRSQARLAGRSDGQRKRKRIEEEEDDEDEGDGAGSPAPRRASSRAAAPTKAPESGRVTRAKVRAASGAEADQGAAAHSRGAAAGDEGSDGEGAPAGSSGSSDAGGASDSDFELESDCGRPALRSRAKPARRPSPRRSARAPPPHGRPTRSSGGAGRAGAVRRSGRSAGRVAAGRYAESDESDSD